MGTGEGQSWDEAENSDATQLTELFLLGATTLSNGGRVQLGHAFNPNVFGLGVNGDLIFSYSQQGSQLLQQGEVVYVTSGPLAGDYNANGIVDAADYTLWRDLLGSTTDLRADGDRNGTVDPGDYLVWKATFGNRAAIGSAIGEVPATPEPAGATLTIIAFLVVSMLMRR
jgi:hypothetical protein